MILMTYVIINIFSKVLAIPLKLRYYVYVMAVIMTINIMSGRAGETELVL